MSNIPDDDEFVFWRYADLEERGIVTNRQDLSVKQRQFGFPRPVRLASGGRQGVALFSRRAVQEWIKERLRIHEKENDK